jgi:hypothetical protein
MRNAALPAGMLDNPLPAPRVDEAPAWIADLGFPEIDLGAMPPQRYGGVAVRPSSVSAYHGE